MSSTGTFHGHTVRVDRRRLIEAKVARECELLRLDAIRLGSSAGSARRAPSVTETADCRSLR